MARKKNMNPETYFKPFPINLRNIMEEFNENQGDLANAITKPDGTHLQRQTISLYVNGDSIPDYEIVAQIAKHYDVTVDCLIGMPNATRSPETDLQGFCKYLNLSENSIHTLKRISEHESLYSYSQSPLDFRFKSEAFDFFINGLNKALYLEAIIQEPSYLKIPIDSNSSKCITSFIQNIDMSELYLKKALDVFNYTLLHELHTSNNRYPARDCRFTQTVTKMADGGTVTKRRVLP